jgi:hypothetical protein
MIGLVAVLLRMLIVGNSLNIGVTLKWRQRGGMQIPPQYFFTKEWIFLVTELKGANKKMGWDWGKWILVEGCW